MCFWSIECLGRDPLYLQSGMDLSHKKSLLKSKSTKISNYTQTPFEPVRPVGPTGRTVWSDRLRPILVVNNSIKYIA